MVDFYRALIKRIVATVKKDIVVEDSRELSLRNQRHNILAHGTDACRIDYIEASLVHEGVAHQLPVYRMGRCRIENLAGVYQPPQRIASLLHAQHVAEVPVSPRGLGKRSVVARIENAFPRSFVGCEVESLVPADWSGNGSPEIILVVTALPQTKGVGFSAGRFEVAVAVK